MRFQPRSEQRAATFQRGASIDPESAARFASSLEKQLRDEGYRDAKVDAALKPAGFRRADLLVHVERGPLYRIREVQAPATTGLEPREVKRVFRRLPYSDAAIESALARTRSLYLAHGYVDAEVSVSRREERSRDLTITLNVEPGPRREIDSRAICRCLLDARSAAEKRGVLDFHPRLELGGAPRPVIEEGSPFTVDRIEFHGNHRFGDATLRRALVLEEGALFDAERLRRSVARLNDLKLFEPIAEQDIEVRRDEDARLLSLIFHLREKPRGRWSLSGPAVPLAIAGPFSASITSRLPAWGSGLLEASTWYASFNLIGLTKATAKLIPFAPKSGILPLFSFERPILPGQRWTSGLAVSPQLSWQATATGYGLAQVHQTFRSLLGSDRIAAPPLAVPVEWTAPERRPARAGALLCDPPKPRWAKLRTAAATVNEFLLGVRPF